MWLLATLVVGTFVSEDLACITAGLLIQRGALTPVAAIGACVLGIFVGDLGLWLVGRLGARATRTWRWLATKLPAEQIDATRAALERHAGTTIVASRFVPGTRLPLYLAAGWVRMSPLTFAGWTFVAALLWTPALVMASVSFGHTVEALITPLHQWGTVAGGLAALVLVHGARSSAVRDVRNRVNRALTRLSTRAARLRRWEFWPMWLFYAPVAGWLIYLATRYGGFSTITAANPGISDGGTVGESKFEILQRLPSEWTIPSTLIRGSAKAPLDWSFPVVLKPDVGQRGAGVRLIHDTAAMADYLARTRGPVLMQPYHEGPFEAGVFYYRFPGQVRGRILSITDKHFPVVVGDGRSTLEELIWAHPRYRMQAGLFLKRHQGVADRVLGHGEHFRLALAGNHAQGTLFTDGAHLWTIALEERISTLR